MAREKSSSHPQRVRVRERTKPMLFLHRAPVNSGSETG